MAFDANRELRTEASEDAPGSFTLRTNGLAKRRRAELEIVGVPELGLQAAGGVMNLFAAYAVDRAEILDGQSVGLVLAVDAAEGAAEGRALLLAVRAVSREAGKTGLWSRMLGGTKGVLRLVDVDAADGARSAPLTALATMLVHRAAVRLAKGDAAGARSELETSIALFPGVSDGGEPTTIDGLSGTLNWQNHLAYADLATLAEREGDSTLAEKFAALARARLT